MPLNGSFGISGGNQIKNDKGKPLVIMVHSHIKQTLISMEV